MNSIQFSYPKSHQEVSISGKRFGQYKIQLYTKTGQIVELKERSDVVVQSSGGGGYVSKYGGHVSAPKISSFNTITQEIWLRLEDGSEECVKLKDRHIEARKGHMFTMLWGIHEDDDEGPYLCYCNNTTGKLYGIKDKVAQFIKRNAEFKLSHLKAGLIGSGIAIELAVCCFAYIFVYVYPPISGIAIWVSIAVAIRWMFRWGYLKKAYELRIEDVHLLITQIENALLSMKLRPGLDLNNANKSLPSIISEEPESPIPIEILNGLFDK